MSIKDFVAEDRALREKQLAAAAAASAAAGGADGEAAQHDATVYRDRKGRKLDMLNQMMRQEAIAQGKAVAEAEEQYEWGKGTVQKDKDKRHEEELANIAAEPFARHKDDAKVDAFYREQIHADDPMAAYMAKKREARAKEAAVASGKPLKPAYKGPAPQPNRFGIRPGYRWDGRDRGNGWEARVQGAAAAKTRNKEASYLYSVSDM